MEQCRYRKQAYECTLELHVCSLCLKGQLADSIELQTSAIANMTTSLEEVLINAI